MLRHKSFKILRYSMSSINVKMYFYDHSITNIISFPNIIQFYLSFISMCYKSSLQSVSTSTVHKDPEERVHTSFNLLSLLLIMIRVEHTRYSKFVKSRNEFFTQNSFVKKDQHIQLLHLMQHHRSVPLLSVFL